SQTPTLTTLHAFAGGSDGANPYTGVIQGMDSNFYGTTYYGGTSGFGTVFQITPAGVEAVLYSFSGYPSDGAYPNGLLQGTDGNFYCTTDKGGANNYGTVFRLTPASSPPWPETVLYSFQGGWDGRNPVAGLLQGTDGNFYSTTFYGGMHFN